MSAIMGVATVNPNLKYYGSDSTGSSGTLQSKVSGYDRPSEINPDDPFTAYDKQNSLVFMWDIDGGSIVTNHPLPSRISERDASLMCFAEQVHKEERDKVMAEPNADPATYDFTDAQISQIRTNVDDRWKKRFDYENGIAKPGTSRANAESLYFAPDYEIFTQLRTRTLSKTIKSEGRWGPLGSDFLEAMYYFRQRNPPSSAVAAQRPETEDPVSTTQDDQLSEARNGTEHSAEDNGDES